MRFLFVFLCLAATVARADPAADELAASWSSLVEFARANASSSHRSSDFALLTSRSLTALTEVEELGDALRRFEGALATAREKPVGMGFGDALAELESAVAEARALGLAPGQVLEVTLTTTEGAGASDAVRIGGKAYALVHASVAYHLVVPQKWLPETHPGTELAALAWACPRARFEALVPQQLPRDVPKWSAYLAAAKAFVPEALSLAHRTAAAPKVLAMEPPEVGHDLRPLARDDALPFPLEIEPIRTWAGQDLTTRTTLPELAEFRRLYAKLQHEDAARDTFANCALMVQKLVVEPLEPAVKRAQVDAVAQALMPFRHRLAQMDLPLFPGPDDTKTKLATLRRGIAVEVVDGLTVDPETTTVTVGAHVKVQGEDGAGWIPTQVAEHWKTAGKQREENVPSLADDPPETEDELAATVRENAATYFVHEGNVDRWKRSRNAKEEADARAAADATFDRFCRAKARFVRLFGTKALEDAVAAYRFERSSERMPDAVIDREIARTFHEKSCGN